MSDNLKICSMVIILGCWDVWHCQLSVTVNLPVVNLRLRILMILMIADHGNRMVMTIMFQPDFLLYDVEKRKTPTLMILPILIIMNIAKIPR